MDTEVGRTAGTAITDRRGFARRVSTETKAAYKTTEFLTYVVVFAGILVASFLVKTGQDGQRVDYFRADKAWWYITLLTIGYMIARGLAESGAASPTTTATAANRGWAGPTLGPADSLSGSRTRSSRGVRLPRDRKEPPHDRLHIRVDRDR
jgi:hypothetical protein